MPIKVISGGGKNTGVCASLLLSYQEKSSTTEYQKASPQHLCQKDHLRLCPRLHKHSHTHSWNAFWQHLRQALASEEQLSDLAKAPSQLMGHGISKPELHIPNAASSPVHHVVQTTYWTPSGSLYDKISVSICWIIWVTWLVTVHLWRMAIQYARRKMSWYSNIYNRPS